MFDDSYDTIDIDIEDEDVLSVPAHAAPARRAWERFKYLCINDSEFLFDVEDGTLERANPKDKHPELFSRLRRDWEEWNMERMPITDEVLAHRDA